MTSSQNNIDIQNIDPVFRKYYRKLCNVANHILNDPNVAEDIVQDVFLKLLHKKEELQINYTIEGYLVRATANTSLNYLEHRKRMVDFNQSSAQYDYNSFETPDQILSYNELEKKIKIAIEKLPPKCKAIFLLSRFEQMKYKEIAECLNISTKTVENQISIALEKLREELKLYLTIGKTFSLSDRPDRLSLSLLFYLFSIFFFND